LNPSAEIGAALQHFQACYQLRTLWLHEARFEGNPQIAAKIRDQLTAALLWLGRPADDIDRVLLMEATEREAFIDSLEAHAPVQRSEEQLAWNVLTQTLGPYIKQSVVDRQIKDLQAQTERRISRLQQESDMLDQSLPDLRGRHLKAMTKLKSTKRSPFLPDLACSVECMMRNDRMPVKSVSSARVRIAKGATMTAEGTGFIASIIQILQGIGVLK